VDVLIIGRERFNKRKKCANKKMSPPTCLSPAESIAIFLHDVDELEEEKMAAPISSQKLMPNAHVK
jgi:hypothetical protein